jgi:hypothetical protein
MSDEKDALNKKFETEAGVIREKEQQRKIDNAKAEVERIRALAREQANEKLLEDGTARMEGSNRITYLKDAEHKADEAITSGVRAYDDWRACVMAMLDMYGALNKALFHTLNEMLYTPIQNAAADYLLLPLVDAVGNLFTGKPEVDLPALSYAVTMSDDGIVQIAKLSRSDDSNEMGGLDVCFKQGVDLWLKMQGYTPDPGNEGKYVNNAGAALDKATFDTLKEDDENGFDRFLKGFPELEFKPRGP